MARVARFTVRRGVWEVEQEDGGCGCARWIEGGEGKLLHVSACESDIGLGSYGGCKVGKVGGGLFVVDGVLG